MNPTNSSPAGLPDGRDLSPNSPFPFACRGCGQLCCVDTDVLASPPEAARIAWQLEREGLTHEFPRSQWGELVLGGSTGLPVLKLVFKPLRFQPGVNGNDTHRYCPFLAPVPGSPHAGICRVHAARPNACRLFPLGRLFDLENHTEHYRLLERCPGFEPADPSELTPPGYQPATPDQTVQSWARRAVHPAMDAEKRRYVEVVQAYVHLGLHAPTRDNLKGQLSQRAALFLGPALFYRIPAAPENPQDDHPAILEWLDILQASAGQVKALLGRARP